MTANTLFTLLSAFALTSFSFFTLRPLASRIGLIDAPGGRKQHQFPTPLIGGVGIYIGTLCISLLTPLVMAEYSSLLAVSGLILFIGIIDDFRELRPGIRIGVQVICAWLMTYVGGNQLLSFGDIVFTGPVLLGIFAIPVTIFATVGLVNAVNMSDGVDGLSGGLVIIALVFLCVVALGAGHSAMLDFGSILIFSLLAFLLLNFRLPWKKEAIIYLGDAGSTLLGFILAWLVIAATQGSNAIIAPVYALWFLAVPLMDTVSLFVKRPLEGRSPFSAGTDHLHHRLLAAGCSKEKTVGLIFAAAIVLGSIGLLGFFMGANESIMFLLFLLLFCFYLKLVNHLPLATSASR